MNTLKNIFLITSLLIWNISLLSQKPFNHLQDNIQIEAGLRIDDSTAYFFIEKGLLKINIDGDGLSIDNTISIKGEFPGIQFENIDAGTLINNDLVLFFSEEEVALYNIKTSQLVDGYPQKLRNRWPGINSESIDAALRVSQNRICLFHSNGFSIIDNELALIEGFDFFASRWSLDNLLRRRPAFPIDAAINWNNEFAFLFSDSKFLKFNTLGTGLIDDNLPLKSDSSTLLSKLSFHSQLQDLHQINTFSFDHLKGERRIHGIVQALPDPDNNYTYEEVTRPPLTDQFVKVDNWDHKEGSLMALHIWSRFQLHNTSQVSIDLALTYNNSVNHDSIHVYVKDRDGKVAFYRFGSGVSKSKLILGEVPSGAAYGWARSVYFPIRPDEHLEIYCKIFAQEWINVTTAWPVFMYGISTSADKALSYSRLDYQLIYPAIFLQGFILMLAIYAFLIYIMNRDLTALYLGIFILATSYVAAFESDTHSRQFFIAHVFPDSFRYYSWISPFMIGIAAASIGAFNRSFLSSATSSKYVDWILKAIIALGLGYAGFILIASFVTTRSLVFTWPIFLLIALIIYLFTVPFLLRQKSAIPYFILAGVAWIIIILLPAQIDSTFGPFTSPDSLLGTITNGPYLTYLALIGQIVIYTLGVGYRSKLVAEEKQRYEELDKMKSRFFTNISHEFRTPLTLILAPLEKIKSKLSSVEDLDLVRLAQDSAHNLLHLINQVLDLSKLETNNVRLQASRSDVIPFLRGVFYSFESLANKEGINQTFITSDESIEFYFDQYKMETIFSNLLSNAFKFSNSGDTISLEALGSKKQVTFKISDTGSGIPIEDLPHVFERFYQAGSQVPDHGSGIGLALVKELVALHHGSISVNSAPGHGTTFELSFPLGKSHLSKGEFGPIPSEKAGSHSSAVSASKNVHLSDIGHTQRSSSSDKMYTILLIEDNKDVRSFISGQLSSSFYVIEAPDGQQGIEKALETIPDLIVCDVMMPVKDGYEVCQYLKGDVRTSHIPIILLTAKAAREEKIEGLQTGADDYLVKPFDSVELETRINNLIELRRKLRTRFSTDIQIKPSEVSVNSMDQEFMQRALSIVEKHMGNEDFGIEPMTKEMGMSATQLNRKLRSLIDQSTNQFIKSTRLQRAADLLKQDAATVSEIAFRTGFRSAAYFVSTFKKQFGMTPGEYRGEAD